MAKKREGKVAVVTGGSAGRAGVDQSELDKAVSEIGGKVSTIQADAAKLSDIDHPYEVVKAEAGRIDVLIPNAGVYELGTFGEITEEHFDKTFNTNVRGLLFTVQKALPLLSNRSSVILIGSIASIKGFPSFSVYDAAKAAVRSFARSWILDLKGRDVRINVLSPGHIDTPGLSNLMSEGVKASIVPNIPSNRLGTPDDIARAAVFLASEDSSYINGTELFVDGGVAQY
jgi:NAD(P)-dependent dehydrogenase (short-subunit alcohol dehydrogenase family)